VCCKGELRMFLSKLTQLLLQSKRKFHPRSGHKVARWRWVFNATILPLYHQGGVLVSIVGLQEAGWAPGLMVRWRAEYLASAEFNPRTVQPLASHYTDYTSTANPFLLQGTYYGSSRSHIKMSLIHLQAIITGS
jgi:hypothetical protein